MMNAALYRSFFAFSLLMALSLSNDPQAVPAQELVPAPESTRQISEREPVNPKVLEFLKPIAKADGDDELVQKIKERHNVAAKLLGSRVEEYRRNSSDLLQVLDAARLVIDAKLDLASDRDSQLAVYQGALEVARLIEQHFQKLRNAGLGTASDLQRAQLARVIVEVQILKLKRQP